MFKKRTSIGFDIGSFSLKCLLKDGDKDVILDYWEEPLLPERSSRNQTLTAQETTRVLSDCLKRHPGFSAYGQQGVHTAVQGEETFFRYLEFPPLTPKELETAVPAQAMKFLPFPLERMNLSFVSVPQIAPAGEKKSAVFIVAAKKQAVEELRGLLGQVGIQVGRMEIPALALAREFHKNHKPSAEEFHALINIGFKLTHVVVLKDRYPYFARDFAIAGRDFTYAFQMGMQISWQEAEAYKLTSNLRHKEVPIEPIFIRWLEEVKKSLDYFNRQCSKPNMAVNSIYLSGGSAAWLGLPERLTEVVGIPVAVDKLDRIKISGNSGGFNSAQFKLAAGLALEG